MTAFIKDRTTYKPLKGLPTNALCLLFGHDGVELEMWHPACRRCAALHRTNGQWEAVWPEQAAAFKAAAKEAQR